MTQNLDLNKMGLEDLPVADIYEVNGGLTINILGIVKIHGVLDGQKGNTDVEWFWE